MNSTEYRCHMRKYARDTAVMSYVVTKHPDYQALSAAGREIIPFLLADMFDPNWHCSHCYGEGFEFPAGWVWDNEKRNWPTDTGVPCTQCNGKGNTSSWACMHLLWEIIGRNSGEGPVVEDWMRGKHTALMNLWRKWAGEHGYMSPVPDAPEEPGRLRRIGQFIWGLIRLWGS